MKFRGPGPRAGVHFSFSDKSLDQVLLDPGSSPGTRLRTRWQKAPGARHRAGA